MSRHADRKSRHGQHMLTLTILLGRKPARYRRSTILCVAFAISACQPNHQDGKRAHTMTDPSMVAGPGEKTLAEKYHLALRLPMREEEFLQTLHRLGVYIQMCGKRDTDIGLPTPRHETSIDLSRVETCYDINGDRNGARAEAWRAFADDQHRIIYVESTYAYPAP